MFFGGVKGFWGFLFLFFGRFFLNKKGSIEFVYLTMHSTHLWFT